MPELFSGTCNMSLSDVLFTVVDLFKLNYFFDPKSTPILFLAALVFDNFEFP